MARRAAHVDDTRRRITEAAVRLHTTVGPSETSFAAVAQTAGVTRLTLYRHFPTRDELFDACMTHWRAQHPPPDPEAWRTVQPFEGRVRRAVTELYRWYTDNADALLPLYRDAAFTPQSIIAARRENIERMAAAVLGRRDAPPGGLRAAIGHVLGFWTWRSLVMDEGCSESDAVELAVAFVLVARRGTRRIATRSRSEVGRRSRATT